MSFEPVDVFVANGQGDPVEGVVVKVYNPDGTLFYTQAISDAAGRASFLLETQQYSMRFYKFQVGFLQPQVFQVLPSPEVNTFDVVADPFDMPISQDPRLCRCSGYFRDLDGSPKANLDIHFIAQFDPVVLDNAAIFASERHVRTDKNGYAQIDLIRGANYLARVEAVGGFQPRCISVPDLWSTNLPDLLLPIVGKVALSPAGPYAVGTGLELELTPTVYDSAGRELTGTATADVQWTSSDPTVAVVLPSGADKLIIRGIAPGTAFIQAARKDVSIISVPNTPVEGQPVQVDVV